MENAIFDVILVVFLLCFSAVVHECAHGWMAEKCGDPTARMLGRITLNPIKHIDPFFTIIMPALLALLHLPIFGGAKPVPINPYLLRQPKRDMMWVAAAGPISNLILVICSFLILVFFYKLTSLGILPVSLANSVNRIFVTMIYINLILAIFNLIPIPPLDGSRVLYGFLPSTLAKNYARLEPFGFPIILGLLYFGALNWITPVITLILNGITHTVQSTSII